MCQNALSGEDLLKMYKYLPEGIYDAGATVPGRRETWVDN